MSFLQPALGTLIRLKARGWRRSVRRRLSTPAGLAFGLIGLVLTALWISSFALGRRFSGSGGFAPELAEGMARGILSFLALMACVSSLSHRGLYLPKDEIDRLLSAPLRRPDLIRYRLVTNLGRSMVFALFMGLVVAPRMPVSGFGFVGTVLAMLVLAVFGQATAILAGDAEGRLGKLVARVPASALRVLVGVGVWSVIMVFVFGDELFGLDDVVPVSPEPLSDVGSQGSAAADHPGGMVQGLLTPVVGHPVFQILTLPFAPWARAMAAQSHGTFWPALALAVLLSVLFFEATARLNIDFRELSMATSAEIGKRLSRLRSGRGAISGGQVSRRALGRSIPWLFGKHPFGAVAWLKCCSIGRKARGTLLFALFVVVLATFLGVNVFRDPLAGAAIIALLGTIYLASGLRYDFRGDLDMMETVKAWPLAPWKVFLATLLPEVVLISTLVATAVLARGAVLGEFSLAVGGVIALTPLVCLLWLALDNAVFLVAPVRFVPGQGGAMHHTGRAVVLIFLRMVILGGVALVCALTFLAVRLLVESLGLEPALAYAVAAAVLAGMGAIAAVIALGGWALQRYDVAREKAMTS